MRATAISPFSFSDFAHDGERREAAEVFSGDDVAAARAAGFEAGRCAANRSREAEDAAALAAIAGVIARERAAFDEARAREIEGLRGLARAFLERFAARLAAAREIEAALDLVDRLLAASADRTSARLAVNASSLGRLQAPLAAALRARGVDDFIELVAAEDVAAGDCRLSWRSGGAERRLSDALAGIEAIFERLPPALDGAEPPLVWRRAPSASRSFDELAAALDTAGKPRHPTDTETAS